ncbi:hypothetical protein [Pseudomonas prosekii]|uniref:hypothetical protein n=1 Tax=Pseudomonas prosekii TaxID=1148509 RepID=UPI003F750091
MTYTVDLSEYFRKIYLGFPEKDFNLVAAFISHVENHGLQGWKGLTKSSALVPPDYPDREERIALAKEFNLWHSHIGYPLWTPPRDGSSYPYTSDWVIHYQHFPSKDRIRIVDYRHHDPFNLPEREDMK